MANVAEDLTLVQLMFRLTFSRAVVDLVPHSDEFLHLVIDVWVGCNERQCWYLTWFNDIILTDARYSTSSGRKNFHEDIT
jgi:hypothetical protein